MDPVNKEMEGSYHLLLEQLDDIIFEMDFIIKEFKLSPKYFDKFGVYFDEKFCFEGDIKNLNLHPDDESTWTSIKDQFNENKPEITEQLRVRNNKGEYILCQVVLKCDYKNERLTFIHGKIADMQSKMSKKLH